MAHQSILYWDDWRKIQAKPDATTKNISFVRTALLLKDMGIKNYFFHLALIDQTLVGVDPHSPNLSEETKLRIMIEASRNYWYFLREVARVPGDGDDVGDPYRANRGNLALSWLYLNHIDVMLIQPRQTGKSVGVDFIWAWILWFAGRGVKISMMTLNAKLRLANIKRLKRIRNAFPNWMISSSLRDADNSERLSYNGFGESVENEYNTYLPQAEPKAADTVGRGMTNANMQYDEPPFCVNIDISIPASLNGTTDAREKAKRKNGFYGNIYTTTAGSTGDASGKYMYEMLMDGFEWTETLYDSVNEEELRKTIVANSVSDSPFVSAVFSHRQLGRSDQWLREVISQNKNTKEVAEKDFLNKWGKGSVKSPLSVEIMDTISESMMEPVWIDITKEERCMFKWYIDKTTIARNMTTTTYVIGMDTSSNTGRDSTTFVARDIRDMSVVCVGSFSNMISLPMITRAVSGFLVTHKNSILVVERNVAQHLIDQLLIDLPAHGIDPFKRLYNVVVEEQTVRVSDFRELQRRPFSQRDQTFYDSRRPMFGFWTGKDSRAELYGSNLQESALKAGKGVRDARLISEISQLIVTKNGRVDHPPGGHDDLVVAWLLGYWFCTRASHLDWYGIDSSKVLSLASLNSNASEQEIAYQEQQVRFREQLDELMEEIASCESSMMVTRLEIKARKLRELIDDSTDEIISIDQFIKDAREMRSKRVREVQNKRRTGGLGMTTNIRTHSSFSRQFRRAA